MTYNSEDVQHILQQALARQGGEFSREQLVEMASDLGISIELLEATEREWQLKRQEARDRKEFNALKRQGFKVHLICYLAVNGFLVLLNLALIGFNLALINLGNFWVIYPILGWGLGLFFHGWFSRTKGVGYEQAFQQWRRQRGR